MYNSIEIIIQDLSILTKKFHISCSFTSKNFLNLHTHTYIEKRRRRAEPYNRVGIAHVHRNLSLQRATSFHQLT